MRLLGLDLASHISGACCGDGSEPPVAQAWTLPTVSDNSGTDYGLLLHALDLFLETALRRWPDITEIAYETPLLITKGRKGGYGDKLSTLRLIYPMSAYVEFWCRRKGLECYEVSVPEAKKEVTGKSNGTKEEIAEIAERCGVILPKVGRLDAGDSWAVWLRLLRYSNPSQAERWQKAIHGRRHYLATA